MLAVLGVIGGALVAWQSYRAIDHLRLKATLAEAYGPEIAAAIIDDQRGMNWAALPQWRQQAALYRLLRRKVGRETAQGIIRSALVDMANEPVRGGDAS